MALATRCPNCHALFRVVADQLKLRGGLVRCGACGHVFDAIGTLSYLDDASLRPVVPPPVVPQVETGSALTLRIPPSDLRPELGEADHEQPLPPEPSTTTSGTSFTEAVTSARDGAPVSGAATFSDTKSPAQVGGFNAAHESEPDVAVGPEGDGKAEPAANGVADISSAQADADQAAESTTEGLLPETASGIPDAPVTDAAAFLQEVPAPRRRSVTIAYAIGALSLFAALALQLAFFFRAELIAQWPVARPAMASICQRMNCSVGWPTRGEMLAVVGSELQSLPGTSALELTAVVRNRSSVTLALPAIEVTLTDTQNRAIARKVFAPVDYLAASDAAARQNEGIEAGADMSVRIIFEVRGMNAAGFVVYPFYL
jgi:predicted Zn finger-like uncharacterized protein